jgi:hypothetical protein
MPSTHVIIVYAVRSPARSMLFWLFDANEPVCPITRSQPAFAASAILRRVKAVWQPRLQKPGKVGSKDCWVHINVALESVCTEKCEDVIDQGCVFLFKPNYSVPPPHCLDSLCQVSSGVAELFDFYTIRIARLLLQITLASNLQGVDDTLYAAGEFSGHDGILHIHILSRCHIEGKVAGQNVTACIYYNADCSYYCTSHWWHRLHAFH